MDPPQEILARQPDLVDKARRGDQAAWEALVRAHQQAVFRLAYLLVADPVEAEDIAQEAFLRAYLALARYDSSRPLRPWLLQIAANLARNRRRSLGRYLHALGRWRRAENNPVKGVEQAAGERLQASLLHQAVQRLPLSDQQVIYLRIFLELPVEEAALAMEAAPGTVKSRLSRALARLRTLIASDYPALMDRLT